MFLTRRNTTMFLIGTSSCFSKWGIPQNHGFQSYSLVQIWMIWVKNRGCHVRCLGRPGWVAWWLHQPKASNGIRNGQASGYGGSISVKIRMLGPDLVQICLKLSTFFLSSWTWGVSKVYCAFFADVFRLFVFFFCKS